MFCQHCGAETRDDLQFCTKCGQALTPAAVAAMVRFEPKARGEVRIGHWLAAGWRIVAEDLATFMLITLLFVVLNGVPLLHGPLLVGLHLAILRKMLLGRAEVGDLFKGFNYLLPALIAGVVVAALVTFGLIFCIVPGMVIAAMYSFTWLFIVDKNMDFWPAMEASHAVVKKNGYFNFLLFLIAGALLNLVGALCFVVGLLVTIPVTYAAITVAYQELVGFEPHGEELGNPSPL